MSFEITADKTVIIIYQEQDFIIYYSVPMEQSWIIYGNCSHNGSCVIGEVNPDLRPREQRLDNPVRPEIECEGCPLRGIYT